ncbi:hypothetical protein K1X76_00890 [bacterium]|nr:hypothetical protein [bacterium]
MTQLNKDIDYYYNSEGLMVLTPSYLKRRGYCCQNGCLHCPYGFKKNIADTNSPEMPPKAPEEN